MPIDPNIALGVRPPAIPQFEIQSPLDRFQRVLSLRNLMTQGESHDLELQQQRKAIQDEQSLGDWMQKNQRPDLTSQEIVVAHPNATGLKFATAWDARQKAQRDAETAALTQHKAFLDNALEEAKTDDRIYNSVTDDQSKTAALTELVRLKRIDGPTASHLNAIPFDSPEFKGIQQRASDASLEKLQRIEAQQKQVALRIAQATESAVTAGTIAEGEKKKLDAANAQKASDAATIAAAFKQSPQAGATMVAALAKIDPKRAEPFLNVTTDEEARRAGLTAEQQQTAANQQEQLNLSKIGKTEPYPQPVQAQKLEEATALAGGRANVLLTPEKVRQDLEIKQKEADIQAQNNTNKALSGDAAKVYSIATTMQSEIDQLRDAFRRDYKGATRGILLGTSPTLVRLYDSVADKVGRLRSGGAINKDEAASFKGQIARGSDLLFGTADATIAALDRYRNEAETVANNLKPKGGGAGFTNTGGTVTLPDGSTLPDIRVVPGGPATGQQKPKAKHWNEKTNRFEER